MRQVSSIPPAAKRSSIPPPLIMPLQEGAMRQKSDTITLFCGRKHSEGRYKLMYYGVMDGKAMLDVKHDCYFLSTTLHLAKGETGHAETPMERKRAAVKVVRADSMKAEISISIEDT